MGRILRQLYTVVPFTLPQRVMCLNDVCVVERASDSHGKLFPELGGMDTESGHYKVSDQTRKKEKLQHLAARYDEPKRRMK